MAIRRDMKTLWLKLLAHPQTPLATLTHSERRTLRALHKRGFIKHDRLTKPLRLLLSAVRPVGFIDTIE